MNQAAYEVNGLQVDDQRFYERACDPRRSVVVEACAGAGKTWMLVSRILRALLDGVQPNHILAITFTKKAAGEMRERLHSWLRDFAHASDERRRQELSIRGVPPHEQADLAPKLQALYGQWLEDGRGVDIYTIHGWFSRLVKAAPLDVLNELQLPPELNLIEDNSELWPALWGRFLKRVDADATARDSTQALYQAFVDVIREVGRFNTEAWLKQALQNRLEITLSDQAGRLEGGVEPASSLAPEWAGLTHPAVALARESVRDHLLALARQLATAKGTLAQKAGISIEKALSLTAPQDQAQALFAALFTDKGEPRKKLGDSPDLAWAQAWLQDLQRAIQQDQAQQLHLQMVVLTRVLFEEYGHMKAERGLADMNDLELAAARLLSDPALSGWIQERLDSQVKQLLMDEFQDTSPLQWQTLKHWLSSYAGAGGGTSGQNPVQVFLVGDPKQSIYRFRRADPRVFSAAKSFVIDALGGDLLACDHTRRNAPGIIAALNKVMGQAHDEGSFPGFRAHTTDAKLPASVRVLPSIQREAKPKPLVQEGWRDSLLTPRDQAHIALKELEAAQVADAVAAMLAEQDIPLSQIFILGRKRAALALVAEALDERGVPHIAPEETLLIDTPEVGDLVAMLDALVSPHHDLSLAHALKSPLFAASDDDLLWLAQRTRMPPQGPHASWWTSLTSAQDEPAMPAALRQAARLLPQWADMAKVAPPHDLLDRILKESDYRRRLLASVPPSQRAQALFHVDALLAQCLELDAGRDATPYRWVRMLKHLPLTLPPRTQTDAVQLLTIHGAKGLEASAVFLIDTDPEPPRKDSYALLVDWPESEERPSRCAFVRSQGKPPPSLERAMAEEWQASRREELNALYVALTRAKQQLIVSRTPPRTQDMDSWWQRLVRSTAIDPAHAWQVQTSPTTHAGRSPESIKPAPAARILTLPTLVERENIRAGTQMPPEQVKVTQQLGQVVHRVLEWLTTLPVTQRTPDSVERATAAAAMEIGLPVQHLAEARQLSEVILRAPNLQPWLDPTQLDWAGNEVCLYDQGQLLRIDRLVAKDTPEGRQWWVLDYKLQHRPEGLAAYRQQLARYVQAVAALQPGERVHAAFITSAGEYVPLT